MKEVGAAVVLPAEPAVRHGEGNGYAGSADVNNIENKLFVITGGGNFYNQLYAAFKVAVAVHNKNNYKALEINEKNAGW